MRQMLRAMRGITVFASLVTRGRRQAILQPVIGGIPDFCGIPVE
jgi:hypothetical protein